MDYFSSWPILVMGRGGAVIGIYPADPQDDDTVVLVLLSCGKHHGRALAVTCADSPVDSQCLDPEPRILLEGAQGTLGYSFVLVSELALVDSASGSRITGIPTGRFGKVDEVLSRWHEWSAPQTAIHVWF